jgi:hypothetical protein
MRDRLRIPGALVLASCALALSACGDDEEEPAGSSTTTTEQTDTATTDTDTTEPDTTEDEPSGGDDSPSGGITAPSKDSGEDQEGGAGDEVPASSQALISGRDGGFHPTVIHVPPFIAIRVELISEDGVEYELEAKGRKIKAGGEIRSASTLFPGIRAGERIVLTGPQGKVTVQADAEPGP